MRIPFTKMQGTGNDFVLIDEFDRVLIPKSKKSEFTSKISDRHFGIGSDGVIFVQRSDRFDAKFYFYNPDGSLAEMCGNGVRCIARYLHDRRKVKKNKLEIETLTGLITAEINENQVRVDMGIPEIEFVDKVIDICGDSYRVTSVRMGNPHAVLFFDDIERIDIRKIGKKIMQLKEFPEGVNVHLVQKLREGEFRIRSYERGVYGETLACGTGICASGVAAFLKKLSGKEMEFHASGGDLKIELDTESEKITRVYLTGPAEFVFDGEIELS